MNQYIDGAYEHEDLSTHVIPRNIADRLGLTDDLDLAEFTTNLGSAALLGGDDMLRVGFTLGGDVEFTLAEQPALARIQRDEIREKVFDLAFERGRGIPKHI